MPRKKVKKKNEIGSGFDTLKGMLRMIGKDKRAPVWLRLMACDRLGAMENFYSVSSLEPPITTPRPKRDVIPLTSTDPLAKPEHVTEIAKTLEELRAGFQEHRGEDAISET